MSNRLLAIGGPAEGEMLPDAVDFNDTIYVEKFPQTAKIVDYLDPDPIEPVNYNYKQHLYKKFTLQFSDGNEEFPTIWIKQIYAHESLDADAATARLREFLVLCFIKGNF